METCSQILRRIQSDIRGKNYYAALELEARGEKVLKLNSGNPAAFGFSLPESIRQPLCDRIDSAVGYCDVRGMPPAREAIEAYHRSKGLDHFSLEDIYIGNGISEIASMICTVLFSEGDEVLMPTPCYSLWVNETILCRGKPVYYRCDEENLWNPDISHIKSLITPRTKAILLINPNNPTGALYSKEILLEIGEIARKNKLIVLSDEIYDRLVFDGQTHTSIAALAPDLPVVTMNGLSKSHCLCGFRCGWLVTSGPGSIRKEIDEGLMKLASMRLSANAIMQTILPEALADTRYTENMIRPGGRLYEQRKATTWALDRLDCLSYVKNAASFYVFPKIKPEYLRYADDREFAHQLLLKKHILLVPGSGFAWEQPDHFRIVMLPPPEDLRRAVEQLGDFIVNG